MAGFVSIGGLIYELLSETKWVMIGKEDEVNVDLVSPPSIDLSIKGSLLSINDLPNKGSVGDAYFLNDSKAITVTRAVCDTTIIVVYNGFNWVNPIDGVLVDKLTNYVFTWEA
ncbi:hypothetical protein [Proteus mirabilis]|uniref:hypothetical protein n=1 Tax=Proteus mirabilis TaxID=584 RepID=UPI0034D607A3